MLTNSSGGLSKDTDVQLDQGLLCIIVFLFKVN